MTSREIVRRSLAHQAADRVPIDFGSTATSGVHVRCVAALREHYGLPRQPVKVHEPYQMLGWLDEDLKTAIGVDVDGVFPPKTLFGFANRGWREFRLPWGQEVLVPEDFATTTAANGDLLIYPEGDMNAPPSGRMPATSYFFDTIIRQEPIDDAKLDPADNLEEFSPITEADLDYFAQEVDRTGTSGRALIACFGGTGLGDIALVPAPFLKHPKGIRDVGEWYISTLTRRDYVHAVFERQCALALNNLDRLYQRLGDSVEAVFICGTDFGTQSSTFCSTATFEELYAPYYRRVNGWVHANTAWKTFKHSCGAVEPLIPLFMDCGFDILNPVQCSAAGMEPAALKERYGDRMVFWGGGVDTQHTLPFGTAEEVRAEVLERCEVFSAGGGFVFNSIHNLQANVPLENVVAMLDAVREFNGAS